MYKIFNDYYDAEDIILMFLYVILPIIIALFNLKNLYRATKQVLEAFGILFRFLFESIVDLTRPVSIIQTYQRTDSFQRIVNSSLCKVQIQLSNTYLCAVSASTSLIQAKSITSNIAKVKNPKFRWYNEDNDIQLSLVKLENRNFQVIETKGQNLIVHENFIFVHSGNCIINNTEIEFFLNQFCKKSRRLIQIDPNKAAIFKLYKQKRFQEADLLIKILFNRKMEKMYDDENMDDRIGDKIIKRLYRLLKQFGQTNELSCCLALRESPDE
ncbi:Hypothetical_protein [Hexamita inflata]|uniref:Hypothetical_protein n=1 Tax=Hexamita inflata TaxID=28002 RepID=A0AA86PDA9_9EUKA|nr:Hypothetical protein HINF_LOCUS24575 [Hexamita inflata]